MVCVGRYLLRRALRTSNLPAVARVSSRTTLALHRIQTMTTVTKETRQKLILDVDTGIDDAHAIMLALTSPAVDVVAITCANGNVRLEDATANTLRVLRAVGNMGIPVFPGAARSLLGKVSTFDNFSGSAWKAPVDTGQLQVQHAANALVEFADKYPGEITLVALAPLTNVALALNLDPQFPEKLRNIVIMGGNTDGKGRVTPCAEFNFFNDPEAAHIVLGGMKNIHLLPFDVCSRYNLSWTFMEEWTNAGTCKSDFLRDSLEFDIKTTKESGRKGYRSCDGYTMATVLAPSAVTEEKKVYATVELSGQLTRGQMVVDWSETLGEKPNVSLIMGLDFEKIQQLFLEMRL